MLAPEGRSAVDDIPLSLYWAFTTPRDISPERLAWRILADMRYRSATSPLFVPTMMARRQSAVSHGHRGELCTGPGYLGKLGAIMASPGIRPDPLVLDPWSCVLSP
ncbi:uncharacterized protein AKAW2_40370S [Aspergillus luchuensis]|uniref:Uncharacterized protein n=1 Tax=Aspergillus kawachii TaxID=1069201 RepID=A0A7R7ZZ97_ASPKA|nr:uncharacterized protein AKAW2_40370S [Aspergillus luchuensis]BCR98687.1 hypothetical protein AKAW2_40370S [Aspergillus luchuensis]